MKDKSTTYGLEPKKVVELLNIGRDANSTLIDINQQKSDLILEKLNETVPIYFSTEQNPSKKLQRLRHTVAVLSGEPIGKLLEDPKTHINLIRMIKDYGRKLSTYAGSEAEHYISNTIYYAAIAHALIYNNIKITNYTYENLLTSYNKLLKEKWMPKNLIYLFTSACETCRVQIPQDNND